MLIIWFLIERLARRTIRCLCELKNYKEFELYEESGEEDPEPFEALHLDHDDPIEEHIYEYQGD